jgi:1-deoxy-D-xylulose-5-phosphate synthase
VQRLNRPVVIHVITQKGKGYGYAEDEPDSYHGVGSFSVDEGIDSDRPEQNKSAINKSGGKKTFTQTFSCLILEAARKDKRITTVTAAMQTGTGLTSFKGTFPDRFFDTGIAEEHAATFAAGLAARGLRPVVAVYSTFIQRSVDQIIHDAALQNLPVIFALDRAGFVGADGETHQGLFDISLFRSSPNMTILAPASENEMRLMLDWALAKDDGPVIIRYPKAYCPAECSAFSQPVETGRGIFLSDEKKGAVCLMFTGSLYREAQEAAALLKQQGIDAGLYNLRFLKPVDEDYIAALMNEYKLTAFIEEGIKEGGIGEYLTSLARMRNCKCETAILAAENTFFEGNRALGTREELLAKNGLNGKSIAERIGQCLNSQMRR